LCHCQAIRRFICIAPPANLQDFVFKAPCPSSGITMDAATIPGAEPFLQHGTADQVAGWQTARIG